LIKLVGSEVELLVRISKRELKVGIHEL